MMTTLKIIPVILNLQAMLELQIATMIKCVIYYLITLLLPYMAQFSVHTINARLLHITKFFNFCYILPIGNNVYLANSFPFTYNLQKYIASSSFDFVAELTIKSVEFGDSGNSDGLTIEDGDK